MQIAAAFTWGIIAQAAPPVARAGEFFLAYPGEEITLNAASSEDPDGDELLYTWKQVGGPEVTLAGDDGPRPAFTAESPGTHRFQLVVTAGNENSAADFVDVVVVDPDIAARATGDSGGCSTTPAAGGLGLVVLLALARRREP
jgi:MYXO-CTERM domain-containing protein